MTRTYAMKLIWPVALLALIAAPALAVDIAAPSHGQATVSFNAGAALQNGALAKTLASYYPLADAQKGVYIGTEYCLSCHSAFRTQRETLHSAMVRRPLTGYTMQPGLGVTADVNGNGVDDFIDGLDFNTISSDFDAFKPNAPKLSVKNGVYTVTVGTLDLPLVLTVAGGNAVQGQRYVVRIPVADTDSKMTAAIYYAPMSWDPVAKKYTKNNTAGWYDANNQPKFSATTTVANVIATGGPSNYMASCLPCHSTGIQSLAKTALGETVLTNYYATAFAQNDPTVVDTNGDGKMELVNITCESCHGPGSNHALANPPDPTKIVNPRKLTAAQQTELCARCHADAKSKPAGTYSFPIRDDTMTEWYPGIGQPISDFFTPASSLWPDGKSQKSGRPWYSFSVSNHATNTFHTLSCTSCHDLHTETANAAQVRNSVYDSGLKSPIMTSVDNNTFCLSCHATHGPFANIKKEMLNDYAANEATIANVTEGHTNHPYGPDRTMGLSRCTTCHMASVGGNHSWRVLAPESTIKYKAQGGQPNSCGNGCHNTLVNIFGLGMRPTSSTYDGAFDQNLATELQKYYGPGGTWWDTHGTPMAKTH